MKARALAGALAGLLVILPATADCRQIVLNPVEPVVLYGTFQVKVSALIDTGAEISSLDSHLAHQMGVDKVVVREIIVRNANGITRRKVIRLKYLLHGQTRVAEFSLIPRDGLSQPLLLGRRALQGFLVDPAGSCPGC